MKEIDRSFIEHIDSKQSQKEHEDLPIYIVSLIGRVNLYGLDPFMSRVTPYFEKNNDKTLLNGFKIKTHKYNDEIIIKNDSKEMIRSDGVLTTQ